MGRTLVIGLALLMVACTTSWARIHGPRVGAGIDLDNDLQVSPRAEVGYHLHRWRDMMSYGFGAGAAWAPVTDRFEVYGDLAGSVFPFLPPPQTSITAGPRAILEDGEWSFAMAIGFSVALDRPPDACTPSASLFTRPRPCPPGWHEEDTIYPDWLPQPAYRATLYVDKDADACGSPEGCFLHNHSLLFHSTFAWHRIFGTEP